MFEILSSEWIIDAITDSLKTVPFLFVIFLFIEIFEHNYADKISGFLKHSRKEGPIIGSITASIPQCGFSVVASTLYTGRFITKGTIVAVYLATSDEAIPILLNYPDFLPYILPLILIKLFVAIPTGYLIDLIFKNKNESNEHTEEENPDEHYEGCCRHEIVKHRKRDFLIHPIKHTVSIFLFILVLTLILNYLMEFYNIVEVIQRAPFILAPLISAIIGLIPNCAVSVGLVLLFVKGAISFGALMSGLMTSSGIGLLVLFKNNKNKKDTLFILSVLVLTGFATGVLIQTLFNI